MGKQANCGLFLFLPDYYHWISYCFLWIDIELNIYGLQIDALNKRIRNYTMVFGIKTGDCDAFPDLQKVTLTFKYASSWNTSNRISPTFKSKKPIIPPGAAQRFFRYDFDEKVEEDMEERIYLLQIR